MLQKSVIVALFAMISAIGWGIAQQVRALRQANRAQTHPISQTQDPDDGGLELMELGTVASLATWREQAIQHGWMLDYREAIDAARAANKPLMIVFRCVP